MTLENMFGSPNENCVWLNHGDDTPAAAADDIVSILGFTEFRLDIFKIYFYREF